MNRSLDNKRIMQVEKRTIDYNMSRLNNSKHTESLVSSSIRHQESSVLSYKSRSIDTSFNKHFDALNRKISGMNDNDEAKLYDDNVVIDGGMEGIRYKTTTVGKKIDNYYRMMRNDRVLIKDRQDCEVKLDDKSYLRGVIDSRLKKLPLKILISSTYSSWEMYISFDRYPTFDNYIIKSGSECLVVGSRYGSKVTSDRSIRFIIYSYRSCVIRIRADFYLSILPEIDLSMNRIDRLKDPKPFLNIDLIEGRKSSKVSRVRNADSIIKNNSKSTFLPPSLYNNSKDIISKIMVPDIFDDIVATEKCIYDRSSSNSRSFLDEPEREAGSYQTASNASSGLNDLRLFYSKKRGYIERVRQQSRDIDRKILGAKKKRELQLEESQERKVETIRSRSVKRYVNARVVSSLVDRFVVEVKLRQYVAIVYLYRAMQGMDRLVYLKKGERRLYDVCATIVQCAKVIRYCRRVMLDKVDNHVYCIRSCVYVLKLKMSTMENRGLKVKRAVGKVFKAMNFSMKLRDLIISSAGVFNKISDRVRKHKAIIDVFRNDFDMIMIKKIENIPSDIDNDLSINILRRLYYDVCDDFFFILFNSKLNDYLRLKIERILKESAYRKKAKMNSGLYYDRDGFDNLHKVRLLPNTERIMRNISSYQLYEEVMKNMKTPLMFKRWSKNETNINKKIETMSSMENINDEVTNMSESFVKGSELRVKKEEKMIWKRLKNLLKFQNLKIEIDDQLASCLMFTLWKMHRTTHTTFKKK